MRKFTIYCILALMFPFVIVLAPVGGAVVTFVKVIESYIDMVREVART